MYSMTIYFKHQHPSSESDQFILKQMCILGSGGVKEQCGRKYWGDGREARVTYLYKLPLEKKKNLPLENLKKSFIQLMLK